MLLEQLQFHVISELVRSLDELPTRGWKRLMRTGFDFYGEEDFVEIQDARTLLTDLIGRGKTAEDLMEGLRKIGNTKAEAIVKNGMKKEGLSVPIQDTGGLSSTCYSLLEEPSSSSMERSRSQAETFPKMKGDYPAPGVDCAAIVHQVFQPFLQCICPSS